MYKIYFLIDPVSNNCIYIGVTCMSIADRLNAHIQESKSKRLRHRRKNKHISSMMLAGVKPTIQCVYSTHSKELAILLESELIIAYKESGVDILNESTGEGQSGMKQSKHSVEKRAASHRARNRKTTDDFKSMMRSRMLGNKISLGSRRTEREREAISKRVSVPVCQFDKNGVLISDYLSITDAAMKTGVSRTAIANNLSKKSKHAGGFLWKYKNKK